ncbi:DUF397 domain-containing protein [Streptomyces caelestis]
MTSAVGGCHPSACSGVRSPHSGTRRGRADPGGRPARPTSGAWRSSPRRDGGRGRAGRPWRCGSPSARPRRGRDDPRSVHVRDSKAPGGPRLTLTAATWARFVARHAD